MKLQKKYPDTVYSHYFSLSNEQLIHERTVYNFLDLLGDIGGLMEIFVLIFGVFLFPLSTFSFTLKAFEKLYLIRTNQSNLISVKSLKKNNKNRYLTKKVPIPEEIKGTKEEEIVKYHHPIKLNMFQKFKLFFSCCKKTKLTKLYELGE